MNWMQRLGDRFARTKSPAPISAESWLLSAMNGTAENTTTVDLAKTVTIRRAVDRVAMDLASVPLVIEEQSGTEWKAVEPAPKGQRSAKYGDVAGVFERANKSEGKTALWYRFHSSMEYDGKAVLFNDYLNAGGKPNGPPKELRFLRPASLTPAYPSSRTLFGEPSGYTLKGSTGSVQLRPDEILWHTYPDPRSDDPLAGVSWTESAAPFGQIDAELPEYVLDYFRNGARGSLLLSTPQTPGEEQRKKLEDSIRRAHTGRGNRFKVIVATHGLVVQELNGRKDTDFPDLFDIVTQRISMASGVPPAFLSDYGDSGVRANLEEQTPIYVEGTLMPKAMLLAQNLTEIVLPRFDQSGRLRARFDWDQMPMVQRMMLRTATSYFTLVGGPILTPNDAREALELPKLTGGDTTYPQGANPLGVGPAATPRPVRTAPLATSRKWIDDPARHAKRIASGVSLDRFEKPAEKMVRAYFSQAEARALHAFETGKLKAHRTKGEDEDFDEEVEVAANLIARIYGHVATARGPEAAQEVGGSASDFLIDDPEVQAFLDTRAYDMGKLITGTTRDLLRQAITTANTEGLTVAETAKMISDVFALRRSQAMTIARTETVRAYNFTTFEAWKQSGLVEQVEWLTANDDDVRDTHRDIQRDGEKVNLGEPFSNGCKFPGDPDGEASETINCRCTLLTVESPVKHIRVAPGTFAKLFRNENLTAPKTFMDKAAV